MVSGALLAAAALLLLVAGLAKLRTPGPAGQMLVTVWPRLRPVRRARAVARAVGVVEAAAAVTTLATGARAAVIVLALCYLAVSAVAVRLAIGAEPASCGCFGTADGAVGVPHLIVDGAALAITAWAVVRPPGGVAALFDDGALTGVTVTAQVVVLTGLAYLSLTALPALVAARRTVEDAP